MNIAFYTLGCKVNQYDTQTMRELFEAAGHKEVPFAAPADVYVINTCTVTQVADKKSRQMISRAHELSPDAKIIVVGCYAQRASEEVLSIPGVSLVAGTSERNQIVKLTEALFDGSKSVTNAVKPLHNLSFENISATHEGRTRAHLKIQDGCDRFCTYCAIPYVRGNIRSRSLENIREELVKLEASGFKEVVLTGIHLMSFGKELHDGTDLFDVFRLFDGLDGIERIRLGSLEPQLLSEEFVNGLAENRRICHQFHLSLQSGSDTVLARMRRRYTTSNYTECCELLRRYMSDAAITTDIIVGFPGETDEEFNETLEFAEKTGFARIHIFPYSRRSGTVAAKMPNQIRNSVKHERAKQLIVKADELEQAFLSRFIGDIQGVLFETCEDGFAVGYTGNYMRVKLPCIDDSLCGTIQACKLVTVVGNEIIARLAQ